MEPILLIDDDVELCSMLTDYLGRHGYQVTAAHHGKTGLETALGGGYAMLLLDVMLPGLDGFEVLRRLRAAGSPMNVLLLTARGEDVDRIVGLEIGADDYLPKPFSLLELQSRMQAITRRKFGLKQNLVDLGGFVINLTDRIISYGTGEVSAITRKEFDLIAYMLLHKNRTLTRSQLSEHIWGSIINDDYDSNYIDAHIKNIRKKLNVYAPPDWLETVRGLGYKIKVNT